MSPAGIGAVVEPFTAEEIERLHLMSMWGGNPSVDVCRRLLATIAARDIEIARLKVDLGAARDAINPLDALADARWNEIHRQAKEIRAKDEEIARLTKLVAVEQDLSRLVGEGRVAERQAAVDVAARLRALLWTDYIEAETYNEEVREHVTTKAHVAQLEAALEGICAVTWPDNEVARELQKQARAALKGTP